MALVVHTHFHHHHTGVTTHTTSIIPPLAAHGEVRWLGRLLGDALPRVTLAEIWRRTRAEKVIWHAHRNHELLLGALLRLLRPRLRVVFTRHGGNRPSAYTRLLARWADELVTLNPENASWMSLPSTVVPHGVDLQRFRPPPGGREASWAALGVGGRHGVGVVGRIRANKGQGDFVDAVAPRLLRFPEWRAVLIGLARGADAAWAEGLRQKTGGALALPGEQEDIVPWYQGLSILVNPSHGESFGLTLIEGMAAGCCVVATKLSHVPTLIEHGRTGFLFEPHDVQGMGALLERLMGDLELARRVGLNAAEEARARFGIAREAAELARVYERALAD